MRIFKTTLAIGVLCAATAIPVFAATATPDGTFMDSFGTSFQFSMCGDGTALCGMLASLEGESATEENLAFVGKQVMQAEQTGPNEWQGALSAGGISADATVTMTSANTIDIQGCRAAILCQTLTYTRV